MTHDINVVLIDFPVKGKEMVVPNEDGSYTVLINAKLSHEMRIAAYNHAMKHIENDDFSKADVQQIEVDAHGVTIPDTAEHVPVPVDKFKKRLAQLRREKAQIQRELQERQKEIELLIKVTGNDDFLYDAAEYHKFFDGL